MTTATFQVNATNLDGHEESDATWYESGTDADGFRIGPFAFITKTGLIFPGVTIPQGATISSAYVELYAKWQAASGNTLVTWKGVAEDNCAVWGSAARPSQRSFVAATVDQTIVEANITDEAWFSFSDITSVVQAIVNRAGWASGNKLGLVIATRDDSGGGGRDQWNDYAYSAAFAPKLHVTYSSGYSLAAGAGSSALSGQTVATKYGRNLSAAAGAHAYTGVAVTLARGLKVAVAAGAHVLSGQAVALTKSAAGAYSMIVGTGAYAHTGVAISLIRKFIAAASAAAYSVAGQAASLLRGYRAAVGTGSYAHTGVAISLLRKFIAAASAAAYSVAGQAVTLTKSAGAGAYSMIAGAGSYLLIGRGVDLIWQSYIAPAITPVRSGLPLSRAGRSKYQDWLDHQGFRR